jgi:hypothetical protein
MLLSGDTIDVVSFEGEPLRDETFLLLMNAHYEPIAFVLPGQENLEWQVVIDTTSPAGFIDNLKKFSSTDDVELEGRATMLLRLISGTQAQARQESWRKRQVEIRGTSAEVERTEFRRKKPQAT